VGFRDHGRFLFNTPDTPYGFKFVCIRITKAEASKVFVCGRGCCVIVAEIRMRYVSNRSCFVCCVPSGAS
jgi:hypothetical protein